MMNRPLNILLLGSTGSIGQSTLDVIGQHPDEFRVVGLSCHRNWKQLLSDAHQFHSPLNIITDVTAFETAHRENYPGILRNSLENFSEILEETQPDLVVNALVGARGFVPTLRALEQKIPVALANKETLVIAGKLVMETAKRNNVPLLPIDSEHSAIWQSLQGENHNRIRRIILTASGGPFRDFSKEQLKSVTLEQALKHPNWNMGPKITIDSATMANKGLEVIEAKWLYGVEAENIDVVIHRESIIHSMVEYMDGSIKAQMGIPDMRIPIAYALSHPFRLKLNVEYMDFQNPFNLHFQPPDFEKFPALAMAFECLKKEPSFPAVFNAANEIAVEAFLKQRISFLSIIKVIEKVLERHTGLQNFNESEIRHVDSESRQHALHWVKKLEGEK